MYNRSKRRTQQLFSPSFSPSRHTRAGLYFQGTSSIWCKRPYIGSHIFAMRDGLSPRFKNFEMEKTFHWKTTAKSYAWTAIVFWKYSWLAFRKKPEWNVPNVFFCKADHLRISAKIGPPKTDFIYRRRVCLQIICWWRKNYCSREPAVRSNGRRRCCVAVGRCSDRPLASRLTNSPAVHLPSFPRFIRRPFIAIR